MGLDTTHGCFSGAYSSFNRFRKLLGEQVGINIYDYTGYGGDKDMSKITHDLIPLFDHSDCDGVLTVEESKSIVKGLNKILENFNESVEIEHPGFKERIIQFRDGCLEAISQNEEIEFQ